MKTLHVNVIFLIVKSWNFQLKGFEINLTSRLLLSTALLALASVIKYITYKLYSPLSHFKVILLTPVNRLLKNYNIFSSERKQNDKECHQTFQCFCTCSVEHQCCAEFWLPPQITTLKLLGDKLILTLHLILTPNVSEEWGNPNLAGVIFQHYTWLIFGRMHIKM